MATKGTKNVSIAFGGFEISVGMVKAIRSRDLKLETVNEAGEKVTSGGGGGSRSGALAPGLSKAVRVDKATVVRLDADDLKATTEASVAALPKMEVLETIDYRQVPTERIVCSYWLQPKDGTARALRLLAEGLMATDRVAVVKWIGTSREKLGVIRVRRVRAGIALLLSEVAFANDFAAPDEDALSVNEVGDLSEREQEIASQLVSGFARRAGDVPAINTATDTAVDARLALYEKARAAAYEEALAGATDDGSAEALEDAWEQPGSLEDALQDEAVGLDALARDGAQV